MRINQIRSRDISNGPGVRVSIFTQGCTQHCSGCFNSETWDLNKGEGFSMLDMTNILQLCKQDHIAGLSILGGEPLLARNLTALESLISNFRTSCPGKTIWLWTGYTLENLSSAQYAIASKCDVVIDGPFKIDQKNINLFYAGSNNQRMWEFLPNGIPIQRKMPSK